MLISEFARVTGLTADTVRFYVRRGLLVPETSGKGGRNPYQVFDAKHVRVIQDVRLGQLLGLSLKEIVAFQQEYGRGDVPRERTLELMAILLARVEERAAKIDGTAAWLRAKIAWMEGGENGPEPQLPPDGQPTRPPG